MKREHTAQKMKFSIKDFFNKCDKIRRKLRISSHLLKKSLMETSFFVLYSQGSNFIVIGYQVLPIFFKF